MMNSRNLLQAMASSICSSLLIIWFILECGTDLQNVVVFKRQGHQDFTYIEKDRIKRSDLDRVRDFRLSIGGGEVF